MKERAIEVLRSIYERIVNLEAEEARVFARFERAEAEGDNARVQKYNERLDELNLEIGGIYRELATAENMFDAIFGYFPVRGKHY